MNEEVSKYKKIFYLLSKNECPRCGKKTKELHRISQNKIDGPKVIYGEYVCKECKLRHLVYRLRGVKCPKCYSTNIEDVEGKDDFLSREDDNVSTKKSKTKTKQEYFCLEENCGKRWKEDIDLFLVSKELL